MHDNPRSVRVIDHTYMPWADIRQGDRLALETHQEILRQRPSALVLHLSPDPSGAGEHVALLPNQTNLSNLPCREELRSGHDLFVTTCAAVAAVAAAAESGGCDRHQTNLYLDDQRRRQQQNIALMPSETVSIRCIGAQRRRRCRSSPEKPKVEIVERETGEKLARDGMSDEPTCIPRPPSAEREAVRLDEGSRCK